jgi:HSP20 family protein
MGVYWLTTRGGNVALIRHRDRPELVREWPVGMFPGWRWFDDLFGDAAGQQLIKVEEFTKDGTLVIRAELPGIDPEKDVEITVEGGMLNITAERREETEKTERDFHRRELRYGSFARGIPLPEGVDEKAVEASYKDGILEVRVPLPTEPPSEVARRIPVARS